MKSVCLLVRDAVFVGSPPIFRSYIASVFRVEKNAKPESTKILFATGCFLVVLSDPEYGSEISF
jgi:hypothetical protein